jgi:peptidoglycan hydrolase FlgJ
MTVVVPNSLLERAETGTVGPSQASGNANSAALRQTADDPRIKEAATQFEAVLLRQMLSSLEKATSSSTGSQSTGGSIYGSMVVNTVADAIANAGGLGLASLLTKSLQAAAPGAESKSKASALDAGVNPKSNLSSRATQPLAVDNGPPLVALSLRQGRLK